MKLIGSLTSPYVRKVRIVMAEKKLDYQLELEDVWTNDAILKSNPLGKVPCLVMDGGEAVFDSRVIVEYIDLVSPVSRLIPEPTRQRILVKRWEALGDIATGVALGYLYFRHPDFAWREGAPNLARHLQKLSKRTSFEHTQPG